MPKSEWPVFVRQVRQRPSRTQEDQMKDLKTRRDAVAAELNLDPSLIAPKAAIEGLVLHRILTPELFPDEVFFAAFEALAHHRRGPNLNAIPVVEEPGAGKGPWSD